MINVDELANEIRRIDGNHSMGAGALAEALMPFLSRAQSVSAPIQIPPLPKCALGGMKFGDERFYTADQMEAYAMDALKASTSAASVPQWIKTKDRMPKPGALIVKRWSNGAVWAGIYIGVAKHSSFDEWHELAPKDAAPQEPKS